MGAGWTCVCHPCPHPAMSQWEGSAKYYRPGQHRTRATVWLAATDSPPVEPVGPDIEAVVGMVADELRVHCRVEHDLFRHTSYIDLQHARGRSVESNALHTHTSRVTTGVPLPNTYIYTQDSRPASVDGSAHSTHERVVKLSCRQNLHRFRPVGSSPPRQPSLPR